MRRVLTRPIGKATHQNASRLETFAFAVGAAVVAEQKATRNVAVLPFVAVQAELVSHAFCKRLKMDPVQIHHCLVRMLPLLDADALRTKESLYDGVLPLVAVTEFGERTGQQKNNSAESAQSSRVSDRRCDLCNKPMMKAADDSLITSDRSVSLLCLSCGVTHGAHVVQTNPYRYFESDRATGKQDPTHWEFVKTESRGVFTDTQTYPWLSDLEELAPYAFAESGTTFVSMQNAARLLHAFFNTTCDGNKGTLRRHMLRRMAAAAAWIIVENPRICFNHSLSHFTDAVQHVQYAYKCNTCNAGFSTQKERRFHRMRCK